MVVVGKSDKSKVELAVRERRDKRDELATGRVDVKALAIGFSGLSVKSIKTRERLVGFSATSVESLEINGGSEGALGETKRATAQKMNDRKDKLNEINGNHTTKHMKHINYK
jgi:hypothetical protein